MTEEAHKADCDGSRPLPNRKREMFVRMLFEGVEATAAYELAGYKRPRGNAQRMEREEEAIAGIDRVDMFEEIEFVRKIGRGRNAREIKLRRFQLKPLSALTPEQRALVEGLEADGLRPILPGKLQAIALIAKLDGLDAPTKIATTDAAGTGPGTILHQVEWKQSENDPASTEPGQGRQQ
jgi:hypothetical protein